MVKVFGIKYKPFVKIGNDDMGQLIVSFFTLLHEVKNGFMERLSIEITLRDHVFAAHDLGLNDDGNIGTTQNRQINPALSFLTVRAAVISQWLCLQKRHQSPSNHSGLGLPGFLLLLHVLHIFA